MATFGTFGDVQPFLQLGRALTRRGHHVVIITDQAHRAAVEAHGLEARTPFRRYDPVQLTTNPAYVQPGLGPYRLWRDIFVPLVPEMFHEVGAALAEPAAVVLVHPFCHGALYAAEVAKVPAASVAMAPLTWWSAAEPGFYTPHRVPRWLHGALIRGPVRGFFELLFGAGLREARRELGLPHVAGAFFALGREVEVSYGLWSPLLRGPAADDPRGATICGFLAGPTAAPLADELRAFLSAGPPPVVVGVGSLLPPMAGDVYLRARDAALERGRRVVLVGAPPELATADTLVVPHAPYATLFAEGCALVHHGGAGSCTDALRSGRPQVVVPFGNDQFDNAVRLERLGVARAIPKQRLTEAGLRAALAWAVEPEAARRADEVRAQLALERDAAEVVADDLERRFGT